jgi:crotonobetainyl-CoA:carnitine CoA-transferase CaiB-like acyl-CoA transferase
MQGKALAGLKVIDLTTTIAGPHCTRLLADLGADVVKIEGPEGDMMRTRPPLRSNASTMYGQLNAGKRSAALDLKNPTAVKAVRALATDADIVVENYRPGVTRRLGLDYAALSEVNPRLIYCSISGYGQTGPSAELAAYAPVIHAASGYDLAHMSYQPGRTQPDNCGVYIADVLTGTYAFGAILAAVNQRHATGKGQHVDVTMLESMLTLTLLELQAAQFEMPPPPKRHQFSPVATKDGYIHIAIASERTFEGIADAADRPDWKTDPRFAKYIDRRRNWADFMEEIESWSRTLTSAEALDALERHTVPASPYRSVKEVMADPQLAHRQSLAEVKDKAGSFKALNPPFRLTASDTTTGATVAALGEHTAEVLASAGLSAEELAALTKGNAKAK